MVSLRSHSRGGSLLALLRRLFGALSHALRRRVLVWLAGVCFHARRCAGLHPIWSCCHLAAIQFWQHRCLSLVLDMLAIDGGDTDGGAEGKKQGQTR